MKITGFHPLDQMAKSHDSSLHHVYFVGMRTTTQIPTGKRVHVHFVGMIIISSFLLCPTKVALDGHFVGMASIENPQKALHHVHFVGIDAGYCSYFVGIKKGKTWCFMFIL